MSPEKRLNSAISYSNPYAPGAYLRRTFSSGLVLSEIGAGTTTIRGEYIIKGLGVGFTDLRRRPGESIEAFVARAQETLEAKFQNKVSRAQNRDSDREFLANFIETHNRNLQPEG